MHRIVLTIALLALAIFAMISDLRAGETYAFLVAVGDYDVKQLRPLKYTRNDIRSFHETLLNSGVKKRNIVLMHDDPKQSVGRRFQPEAEKIRKEFDLLLLGLKSDDVLIVALSGHGVQFENEKASYFCPADAVLNDPKRTRLISIDEFYNKLDRCRARQKLLLVDACRNDPLSAIAKSRETVELETITRPQELTVPKGIVALFSCSAGQESFEWPAFEHGVFFHHVIEGWNGKADDGDGELTLEELKDYTYRETFAFVRSELGGAQTPAFKGEYGGRWVLRKLRANSNTPANSPPGRAPSLLVAPFSEREAKAKQVEWAKHLGQPSPMITNSIGMTLVLIPPGQFPMGGDESAEEVARQANSEARFYEDEHPQHSVKITRPFFVGVHEVTQENYQQVMGNNPSFFSKSGDGARRIEGENDTRRWPVEQVSWEDAQEFCRGLSNLPAERSAGRTYRLPTEAEWEYACRAGTTTPFHFGERSDGRQSNSRGEVPYPRSINERDIELSFLGRPTVVGSYAPNAFGLSDMHGNVAEWCVDWYGEDYYQDSPGSDPKGPDRGTGRVTRGGSWIANGAVSRAAKRHSSNPSSRVRNTGFRVVCELK